MIVMQGRLDSWKRGKDKTFNIFPQTLFFISGRKIPGKRSMKAGERGTICVMPPQKQVLEPYSNKISILLKI